MKILDVPQSGGRGLTVSQNSRNSLVSRALVIPTNPQTEAQLRVCGFLRSVSSKCSSLTPAQRDAWTAEADQHQSRARLGQSGALTGLQLFVRINRALLTIGQPEVTAPPAAPVFDVLPVPGLTITNVGGVVTLKLTATGSPPEGTMLWGATPCSQGVNATTKTVFLGTLESPVGNEIDISAAYTAATVRPRRAQRCSCR